MPPKTPEQLQEDFRKQQRRMQQAPAGIQQAAPQLQRPKAPAPVTVNYMGPPEEQPAKPEEQTQAGPTGFVGFGQLQAANVEAAQRMAERAGEEARATRSGELLGTEAGRQALLQRAFGTASELDAALAGAAAPTYLQQLEQQYGAAAQERAAAARREAAARAQQQQREQAARDAATLAAARPSEDKAVSDEASRLRAEDARRPRGQVTAEKWANLHGMTLEQWIKGGKRPAY